MTQDDLFKEKISFPSKGLYYGDALPGGECEIRPFTTQEERILFGDGDVQDKLDWVTNRCLILPKDFSALDLLSSDRFYALIMIRQLSYGQKYTFSFRCPSCESNSTYEVDLSKMPVLGPMDETPEPFEVFLPACKKTVGYRLLRSRDDRKLSKLAAQLRQKGTGPGDPIYMERLAAHIQKIDGAMASPAQAIELVGKLLTRDSEALRSDIADREPGVDLDVEVTCKSCGYITDAMKLPVGMGFFRSGTGERRNRSRVRGDAMLPSSSGGARWVGVSDEYATEGTGETIQAANENVRREEEGSRGSKKKAN